MKNGRDNHYDDPKVTSLAAARKKAEKAKKAGSGGSSLGGGIRDWIFGGVLVLMAAGMLVHWGQGLLGAAKSLGQ